MLPQIYSELNFVLEIRVEVFSCARTCCDSAAGIRVGSAKVFSSFSIRMSANAGAQLHSCYERPVSVSVGVLE